MMNMLNITTYSDQFDALLVTDTINKRYLTQFTGSGGYLLMTAESKELLVAGKYVEQIFLQSHDCNVVCTDHLGLIETLKQRLAHHGIQRLGIEANALSYAMFCQLDENLSQTLVATTEIIETLRQQKTDSECVLIKKACAITEQAIEHALTCFTPNMTEKALGLLIEFTARELGADDIDFLIVVSGKRGALPHGRPSDKPILMGELVTIDFGIVYRGYHSDVTRTFAVGEISHQLQHLYDVVFQAQQLGVSMLGIGVATQDIDTAVRNYIQEHGYGQYFIHGLGHGVGLQGHEIPFLNQHQNTVLQQGMIVTIEPGVYIPNVGGVRIEDTLLITDSGAESLTHLPRQCRDITQDFCVPVQIGVPNK